MRQTGSDKERQKEIQRQTGEERETDRQSERQTGEERGRQKQTDRKTDREEPRGWEIETLRMSERKIENNGRSIERKYLQARLEPTTVDPIIGLHSLLE
jgi:hypothetical protein